MSFKSIMAFLVNKKISNIYPIINFKYIFDFFEFKKNKYYINSPIFNKIL